MDRLLAFGFLLLVIDTTKFSVSAYSGCPKDVESHSATLRLRRHLFCDYDSTVRPVVHHDNSTSVTLRLIPKFIEFDDRSNTLALHTWMTLIWEDAHLTWDSANFDGVTSIHVTSDEIWVPDISIYNSGDMGYEQAGVPRTDCMLANTGLAMCVPAVKYVARCAANYQHWPFDRQNCTLRLGSWAHTGEEIDYHFPALGGIEMRDFTPNREWKVISVNATKKVQKFKGMPDSFPSMFFDIVLERHSTSLQTTVVGPIILLIVMTLAVLWLNPTTSERMILAAGNLMCHLLCVIDVNWQVPFNGSSLPSILVFHQNSMIIASVALLMTVVLRQMEEMSISAPIWLTSTTSAILTNRVGQFLLLTTLDPKASATLEAADDNAGLVQPNSSSMKPSSADSEAWHHFAKLLDRLFFAVVILVYFIMMLVLIPKNDINEVPDATSF